MVTTTIRTLVHLDVGLVWTVSTIVIFGAKTTCVFSLTFKMTFSGMVAEFLACVTLFHKKSFIDSASAKVNINTVTRRTNGVVDFRVNSCYCNAESGSFVVFFNEDDGEQFPFFYQTFDYRIFVANRLEQLCGVCVLIVACFDV